MSSLRRFAACAVSLVMLLAAPTAAGASSGGAGWGVVPSPNPTTPTAQINGGTCVNASHCVAVGSTVRQPDVGEPLAEHWDGTRWTIDRTAQPAHSRASAFVAASCPTASFCMAVGYRVSADWATRPLAERWNGTGWTLTTAVDPAGTTNTVLYAVSCQSVTSCVAVGNADNSSLVERWNGTAWHVEAVPVPSGAQSSYLDGVSCTTADSCEAVGGSDLGPMAERWNGKGWRLQTVPDSASGGGGLNAVSCPGPTVCVAAGGSNDGSLAERWQPATGWQIAPTPNPNGRALYGVSCSTSSACTAVGQSGSGTLAERWNGTAWTIQHARDLPYGQSSALGFVSCPANTSCMAFGSGSTSASVVVALVERWADGRWRREPARNPIGVARSTLQSVSCARASLCVATGYGGPHTLAERWNGQRWVIDSTPSPSTAGGIASVLDGVACPAAATCLAVGGSYNASFTPVAAIAERWNGSAWTMSPVPLPAGAQNPWLTSVACPAPSSCVGVGFWTTSTGVSRTLGERWNGSAWTMIKQLPSPHESGPSLNGVSCASATACMAVGAYLNNAGTFVPFTEQMVGTTWTILNTPDPDPSEGTVLTSVSCVSSSACTAVGQAGPATLAEHWDGTSWSLIPTHDPTGGQGSLFQGVSCTAAQRCTAVGVDLSRDTGPLTLAEVWNGVRWTHQPTPVIPGAGDLDNPVVDCPTRHGCVMVGGYTTNIGPKLTLTERWPVNTQAPAIVARRPYIPGTSTARSDAGDAYGPRDRLRNRPKRVHRA
jgi:hypothetical protein